MNNQSNSAVIISADARLKRILLNNTSKTDRFQLSLEDNIADLASKAKSDAYIYDVELSNDDLYSTIAAITELKRIISKKPLILIGRQDLLNQVLSNEVVASMVSKTINKPISSGQLQLAISSSLLKPHLQKDPMPQSNSSKQRRIVVAALSFAFVSVSALAYLKTKESPSKQIDYSLTVTTTNQNLASANEVNLESDTQSITQYNQSALLAVEEGRLTEPANNNAVYYLNQIKKTDPYNAAANQTHKKIFELLEVSYLENSSRGNNLESIKALNKILDFEPYNHKYAQLLRELKERIYLDKESSVIQNTQQAKVTSIDQNVSITTQKVTQKKPELTNELTTASSKKFEETSLTEENKFVLSSDNVTASINKNANITPKVTVKPAEILHRTEPVYPKVAADLNYEGWVELEYQVDVQGHATNIKVLNGDKTSTFKNASIQAIRNWTFSPAVDLASDSPKLSTPMSTRFNFILD